MLEIRDIGIGFKLHSIYCCVETFVYLDNIIFWAIYESGTVEFTRSMYDLNVISKDICQTMTKIRILESRERAFVLSKLLMEGINNPKGYKIFKESLRKKNSLKKVYNQMNFVGKYIDKSSMLVL